MKILIAEDNDDIALSYKLALEKNNHEAILTPNGEECIKVYQHKLEQSRSFSHLLSQTRIPLFDALILDYKMPKKDGMEVAREILELNPHERIIFASAYVKETLVDSVKWLKQIVELMQKPFDMQALVDTIEDKEIYKGLEKLNVNVKKIKNLEPTHEQLKDLFEGLREIMKGRSF